MNKRIIVALVLVLGSLSSWASPVDEARRRVVETFTYLDKARLPVDPAVIAAPWAQVPFDQTPFTYTFAEIETHWDRLMRGLKIPFPSPAYLQRRAERFPQLMNDTRFGDTQWDQHSLNVLEVWQAFFRGDLRKARDLGLHYRGYAIVPGVFAQIIQAVYLTKTYEEKQMLLQDAIDLIREMGVTYPFLPGETEFEDDYAMMRLGLAYAVGRLAEDEPVPRVLQSGYAPLVINLAAEILAVDPEHAVARSLNAAFDANVIRRVGRTAGRVTFGAEPINAIEQFDEAIDIVDDMAILRYEFANTLLYLEAAERTTQAIAELEKAVTFRPYLSMDALDILYARKRLAEIANWQSSDMGFRQFDRLRRKHLQDTGQNPYSVLNPPFSP